MFTQQQSRGVENKTKQRHLCESTCEMQKKRTKLELVRL